MKNIIRKSLLAAICIFGINIVAMADNDKPITVSQLPETAQQTLNKYFPDRKVSYAKVESGLVEKSYDVIFTNGEKLEFDRKGNWTEISCKRSAVPTGLVPTQIMQYVKENYSGERIVKIEKEDKGKYEVTLSNRFEIVFNKKYQVIDIDFDD